MQPRERICIWLQTSRRRTSRGREQKERDRQRSSCSSAPLATGRCSEGQDWHSPIRGPVPLAPQVQCGAGCRGQGQGCREVVGKTGRTRPLAGLHFWILAPLETYFLVIAESPSDVFASNCAGSSTLQNKLSGADPWRVGGPEASGHHAGAPQASLGVLGREAWRRGFPGRALGPVTGPEGARRRGDGSPVRLRSGFRRQRDNNHQIKTP